jgi:Flp pilus assembly protein CpaB
MVDMAIPGEDPQRSRRSGPGRANERSTGRKIAGVPRALPNTRSFVGALLCVSAALIAWYAATGSSGTPQRPLVVAARDISAGLVVTADDLRVETVTIRPELRIRTFADPATVIGRAALGPIAAGDPVLRSATAIDGADGSRRQVSFTLPIAAAVGGTLRSGDTVDILATVPAAESGPDVTRTLAHNVLVSRISGNDTSVVSSSGDRLVTLSIEPGVNAEDLVNAGSTGKIHLVKATGSPRVTERAPAPDGGQS